MIGIDVARDGLLDAEQFGVDEAASYRQLEIEIQRAVLGEYPEENVMVSVVGIDGHLNSPDYMPEGDIAYIESLVDGVIAGTSWIVHE